MAGAFIVDWWSAVIALGAAGIGGLFTMAATRTTLKQTLKNERTLRVEQDNRRDAEYAFSALLKLFSMANETSSLYDHIALQLKEAEQKNDGRRSLTEDVGVIFYDDFHGEPVLSREISFLARADRIDLLHQIHLFQRNFDTNRVSLRRYNALRSELTQLMRSEAEYKDFRFGEGAKAVLTGQSAQAGKLMLAEADELLKTIILALQREQERADMVRLAFSEEARMFFGDAFPVLDYDAV
ncbi:hypothetical protein [Dinoroseobacter sp. S76]|uniref:hypothetical protein n=1 Tax=Dinoroseobacter sp. S76 TaxID=3415124 RepID=UPI003C7BD3C6